MSKRLIPDNVVFWGWDEKALWGTAKIRLSPQQVAQVVARVSLELGYDISDPYPLVGDGWHFVITHEGDELGRVTVEPAANWPRYFSTSMPQLIGIGERPVHRKSKSMEPMHPIAARFTDLVMDIHKQIKAEIDFVERMSGREPETAANLTSEQSAKRKGGRPSNIDNDWAREQVHTLGRIPGDVYRDWLDRIGTKADTLDDPYDSFKKAIKPKKGK